MPVPSPPGDALAPRGATGGGVQGTRQEEENFFNNFPGIKRQGAQTGVQGAVQAPPLPVRPAAGKGLGQNLYPIQDQLRAAAGLASEYRTSTRTTIHPGQPASE